MKKTISTIKTILIFLCIAILTISLIIPVTIRLIEEQKRDNSRPTFGVTNSQSDEFVSSNDFTFATESESDNDIILCQQTKTQELLSLLIPISILLMIVSIMEFTATKKDIQTNITDTSQQEELSKKASNTLIGEIIAAFILCCFSLYLHIIANFAVAAKPIIYLYPTTETKVTVELGKKENLTCTYPKYEDSWEVLAKPNGDLTDLKTGRNLYSLYWEGKNTVPPKFDEGFVIKGEDTITFLEEKLAILGLTEREANEFIIYWLPQLEKNKYNFIRFQTIEEINENMPLEISPKPDTIIRIMMEFKPLNQPFSVPEQELHTPTRNGFVAVEWGGTEL